MKTLAAAIKEEGEDRSKIRDAILAAKGYKGVLGTFSFTRVEKNCEISVVEIQPNARSSSNHRKLLKVVNVGQ